MENPVNATEKLAPRFVVIGAGTGSFTVLSGLKNYIHDITALVNMADDGGSSGQLRDEQGVLPPGDVRQCLVALSQSPKLRDLFDFRFSGGSLDGHSFGNLFLSAVEKITNNFGEAVELAAEVLHIQGRVLPLTLDDVRVSLTMPDGSVTHGELKIGNMDFGQFRRPEIKLEPQAHLTSAAHDALMAADVIVIAPGNLYGSLAPALVIDGVREALLASKAKIAYVCNLVTKPNQTTGFKVHDYAAEIERFIGAHVLDIVLYNSAEPPAQLREAYMREDEFLVEFDSEAVAAAHYRAVGLALIAQEPVRQRAGDKIAQSRSLIRHDSDVLAQQLIKLSGEA